MFIIYMYMSTTNINTLSLHDALPISRSLSCRRNLGRIRSRAFHTSCVSVACHRTSHPGETSPAPTRFLNGTPRGVVQGQAPRLSAHLSLPRPTTALRQSRGSTPRCPNPTCNMRSRCRRDPLSSRRKNKSAHSRPSCNQRRQYRSLPSDSPLAPELLVSDPHPSHERRRP